jgi:citrate synthase
MTKEHAAQATTHICGYDANHISVRGKDLVNDLVGQRTFTQALLLQALGEDANPLQVAIVDAVLVTIMEHGLVPSAIVTRLTHHGAPESFQGAIAAGLLGVGDRYAGTASECGGLLERIAAAGDPEAEALTIVRHYREQRRPLPGFGHPIHRQQDPRVERLLAVCREAGASGNFINAMERLERTLCDELGKPLVTNISAAIGAALAEAGVPSAMMRGIVLTARCAGLVGHLFEEMNQPVAHALWEGAQEAVSYEP